MMRVLLLAIVVAVHCLPMMKAETAPAAMALETLEFMGFDVLAVCVNVFFIISGYLFFAASGRFDMALYRRKLLTRVHTLVVPYLIWNALCGVKLLVKARTVGLSFETSIIQPDGAIDWLRFIEGFVAVPGMDGFPYAFAFWFIRNLIVFVVVSPLVALIVRRWWSYALFMVVWIAFMPLDELTLCSGFEWFVTGAALAATDVSRLGTTPLWVAPVAAMALVASGYFKSLADGLLYNMWMVLQVLAMAAMTLSLSVAAMRHRGRFTRLVIGSSFFVYAFHQCCCTLANRLWFSFGEITSYQEVMLRYLGLFVTFYAACVSLWMVMRRCCPRLLNVMTGSRN